MSWLASNLERRAAAVELGFRRLEADGTELAALARADQVEVFHGRRTFVRFSLSPEQALALAFFLLGWWARGCWFGLLTKVARRSVQRFAERAGG